MSVDHKTGLQLRSLIKKSGELELSLAEVAIPEPAADEVVVRVGMLLLPRRLVRSRHRLLQTLEDRVEGDPLLALQLAERRDHLGVQACVPFSSAAQSTTVRADAIS